MELVRAASLSGYFAVAEELRLDVVPLLRSAGLARSMMDNPEQMLPARSVVRLLEASAEASGCITFGLMMAERRQISDIGMVSLLIIHQPTLRDALEDLSPSDETARLIGDMPGEIDDVLVQQKLRGRAQSSEAIDQLSVQAAQIPDHRDELLRVGR